MNLILLHNSKSIDFEMLIYRYLKSLINYLNEATLNIVINPLFDLYLRIKRLLQSNTVHGVTEFSDSSIKIVWLANIFNDGCCPLIDNFEVCVICDLISSRFFCYLHGNRRNDAWNFAYFYFLTFEDKLFAELRQLYATFSTLYFFKLL